MFQILFIKYSTYKPNIVWPEVTHLQWNMSLLNFDTVLFTFPSVLLDKYYTMYVKDSTIHDMNLTLMVRNDIQVNKVESQE